MILTLRCEDLDLTLATIDLPIIEQSYIDEIMLITTHESGNPITSAVSGSTVDEIVVNNNVFDIVKGSILDLAIKSRSSDPTIASLATAILNKLEQVAPEAVVAANVSIEGGGLPVGGDDLGV